MRKLLSSEKNTPKNGKSTSAIDWTGNQLAVKGPSGREEERMIFRLDGRVRKLEREARPKGLRAAIQGFVARDESKRRPGALNPNDPILQQGVDDDGEAVVSRWWSVMFFEGTREQQNDRLTQL